MKPASLKEIKQELSHSTQKEILELCLRLARFKKENTRVIYPYILFKNRFFKIKDQKIKVRILFFKPDGSRWGIIDRDVSVSGELDLASYDKAGWGWEKAGNWPRGLYKVQIYFDGNKAGESSFEIY